MSKRPMSQPRKSLDESRRERGSLPSLFARQSSLSVPSSSQPSEPNAKGTPPRRTGFRPNMSGKIPRLHSGSKKSKAAPRSDQEVILISSSSDATHITISSDTPSHISISSGSVEAASQTRKSLRLATNNETKGSPRPRAPLKPVASTTSSPDPTSPYGFPPSPPPPMSVPRRPQVCSSVKPPSPLKRALQPDSDSEGEVSHEPYHMPRQVPVSSKISPYGGKSVSLASPSKPRKYSTPSPAQPHSGRNPTPPKRARPSPSNVPVQLAWSSGNDADSELVPSSQSEEQELCLPKIITKNAEDVRESVDKWRREASIAPASPKVETCLPSDDDLPSAEIIDIPMDVDTKEASTSTPRTPHSETEVSMQLWGHSSVSTLSSALQPAVVSPAESSFVRSTSPYKPVFSADPFRPITPPPTSDPSPLPPTPVALDTKSKTAQIIADIKAKALAAACLSSPEPVEFKEPETSSSEESDDDLFAQLKMDKGKGKAVVRPLSVKLASPESSSSGQENGPRRSKRSGARYNLRHQPQLGRKDVKPRLPALLSTQVHLKQKAARKSNPLEALLKEKRLADKRGNGTDALRAAEAAVASPRKRSAKELRGSDISSEDEEHSEEDPAWADEDAASEIVRQGTGSSHARFQLPSAHSLDEDDSGSEASDDEAIEGMDCEQHLGEGAKQVALILERDIRDRKGQAKGKQKARALGVYFWNVGSPFVGMEEQNGLAKILPPLPMDEAEAAKHPLLLLLWDAVQHNDVLQTASLLQSHALMILQLEQITKLVPWIFGLACSPSLGPLNECAYTSLLHLSSRCSAELAETGFSFSVLLDALIQLGASPAIVESVGWVKYVQQPTIVAESQRAEILYCLVSIIASFARTGAVPVKDISDIMLALLLVGMDPSTTLDLRRDITNAISYLGEALIDNNDDLEMESAICSKIAVYAKSLDPMNRAYLLSFITGGCPQTRRLARMIARNLLLGSDPSTTQPYESLPSLFPIIELLSPPSGSEALFDILGNTDKDHYFDDLVHNVEILSRALMDIDAYAMQEKQTIKNEPTISGASGKNDDPVTPLGQIRTLLDGLHGKIVDTRAAHLDRSRAKAALQRLSFRVHYQRSSVLGSGSGHGKPANLHRYFIQPRR